MARYRPPHLLSRPGPEAGLRSVAAPDGGGEWVRGIAMALMGLTGIKAAHLDLAGLPPSHEALDTAWRGWWADTFLPRLLPLGRRLWTAAAGQGAPEACLAADLSLDAAVRGPTCQPERSLQAARALREAVAGQKHFPLWNQLERAIASGKTPGHFLTLLLVRAAAYQIPPGPALAAAACHEWRAAAREDLGLTHRLTPEDFAARHGELLPALHPGASSPSSTESLLRVV